MRHYREKKANRKNLETATTFSEWKSAAKAFDKSHGLDAWKEKEESELYDYISIRSRLNRLRELLRRRDDHGLLFALNEGIHGNMGGMGKSALYNKAAFGTKKLITDYVDAISEALLHLADEKTGSISFEDKQDFFRRASHCFGRSALMFSGGGNLIYFHIGVAKVLLQQNLLPGVMSGSSAGAMLVAILGTHTNAQLKQLLKPEKINFGDEWVPSTLERITGIRRIFGPEEMDASFTRLIPDMTFAEAFKLTGRHINISVSPVERHQTGRLLNATTSPNVLIRSAVKASCAVPGFVGPVTLFAKDAAGNKVPYLASRTWMDGSIADDLPAKRLSRLYGINHYIVSQINPYALDYLKTPKPVDSVIRPFKLAGKEAFRQGLQAMDSVLSNYKLNKTFANMARLLHSLMGQDYRGDINIVLDPKHFSPFRIVSPCTVEEVAELIQAGEKATWPKVEQIRISSKIGRTLDHILQDYEIREHAILEDYEKHQTGTAKLKLVNS